MKAKVRAAITAVVAVGAASFAVIYFVAPRSAVPNEFVEARVASANLAARIVDRSSKSLATLGEIAAYDKQGDRAQALTIISKQVIEHRNAQQDAIELSTQLERMARSLSSIKPERARILATEGVSAEVALVSRLLSYNDYLLQLFETLRAKFSNPGLLSNGKVNDLIAKINDETRAINELNSRSTSALASFDEVFK